MTGALPSTDASGADYNLRILWPLARWVEAQFGMNTLEALTEGTGIVPSQFDLQHVWVAASTFETLVSRARALMPDEDMFMRACAYRIKEAYGPIRYVLWATSPSAVYAQAVRNYRLVATVGRVSVVAQGRTHLHMRVEPQGRTISRLTCLVRQANCKALPTMWGLPAAHVREEACVGRGDPTCELHLRWYAARSAVPVLAGAILFSAIGFALSRLGIASVSIPAFLGLLGGTLGYLVEVMRTERINRGTREEIMDALRKLAAEEAETRREIVALHLRQKEWTRHLEEQVSERTRALERVVVGMEGLQEERVTKMLGFSHDLRNPLQVLQFGADALRMRSDHDAEAASIVDDMEHALAQMKRMLGELVNSASGQRGLVELSPQRVEVADLTERLRRRLRALVHGREVRSTVFATREAPSGLDIDPLVFDRIVDNLLTNAAKYTERGSIVVELDGTPGFLVIKVSDTGCGIDPVAIDRVFEPGGSSVESRRGDSFGVGLSVVVQLLDQIGGRLEVMSRLTEGTTFWVHLPLCAVGSMRAPSLTWNTAPLSRVVRIRRMTA